MKALTLTEPFGTLVAIKKKSIETRSWRTSYTGALAIHSAKGYGSEAELSMTCFRDPFYSALMDYPPFAEEVQASARRKKWIKDVFPLGCVVATCNLVACVPTEMLDPGDTVFAVSVQKLSDQELQFGDFSKGRWGWLLKDVKMLPEPIPAKGALGLWEWRLDYFEGEPGIPGEVCICSLQSSSVCPKHGPVRRTAP